MEKLQDYEIRRRGEFMFDGVIIRAANPTLAMLDPKGGNNTDSMIINKSLEGEWFLISKGANHLSNPIVKIDFSVSPTRIGEVGQFIVNPDGHDPQERLALAKACEKEYQHQEKNPTMEFSDFDKQLIEYQKRISTKHSARCLKECAVAETEILAEKKISAKWALQLARDLCQSAINYAEASHTRKDTKPNSAEVTAAGAKKQFNQTVKKYNALKNKSVQKAIVIKHIRPSKADKSLGY